METTQAIVSTEPGPNHIPGSNWSMQPILVPTELKPHELLVEMVAVGICHTDLVVTSWPSPRITYPRVAGHEGSGYIKATGSAVSEKLKVGDPVLLSFACCKECHACNDNRPSACETFSEFNSVVNTPTFNSKSKSGSKEGEADIAGRFFGQSSFAKLSVVREECVLPAEPLIQNADELKLFAPLGCGIQTGAGSVLNVAKPGKEDVVMVMGLGGVGLSAVMAAAISGCRQVIAVDRIPSRIDLAKSVGASDGLDTTGVKDLAAAMKEITQTGRGPTVVIDTTGVPSVLNAAYAALAKRGTLVLVGIVIDPKGEFKIEWNQHLGRGLKLVGCVEGDSVPKEFIPKLIEYYRLGKMPIDRMTKYYKAEDFKTALHDMHSGGTVKAVLTW